MAREPLRYHIDLAGTRYELRRVRGEEALSSTWRFEVTFHAPPTDPLDPREVVSGPATIVLAREHDVRSIRGHVTSITRAATKKSLLGASAGGGEVRIVVEPRLAMLRKRADIRVFRDKDAPTIVEEVMTALGVKVERRLRDTYVVRPYCVQFREADYDFCARLLEDEGIFYFLLDDGTVVMGDHPTAYDDRVAILPFRHGSALDQNDDSVHAIGQRGVMTAGKISLRDFNPDHPSLNMDVQAPAPTEGGAEWYDYPGEYLEPTEGRIKARKRADALACIHQRLGGSSFCAELRSGARFELGGAPMGVRDGGYVVARVTHDFTREGTGFSVGFEALRESITFRPEPVTPVPTEPNPLTGFVTGPKGADIHTDAWGRVKVHFPWDRRQPKDDRCSHWVPILQDNTGQSSAIPRTEWEVLCQFLEGDPDRPVILGRVYNAEDPHYTPLPDNKTRTSLRSLVSPRTVEGSNYIQFEDKAGAEAIMIAAHRDQNVVIGNDKNEQVDVGENHIVRGDEAIMIGAEQRIAVSKNMAPEVEGNQLRTIAGRHSVDAGNAMEETITKNHRITIGGTHLRTAGSSDMIQVGKNLKESVGALILEASLKGNTGNAGRISALIVGGAHVEVAKKSKMETAGKLRVEAIGGLVYEKSGKELATRVEKNRKLVVGATMNVDALKNLLIAGAEKLVERSATAAYTAAKKVTLKVGSTELVLGDGKIEIKADEAIHIETSSTNQQKTNTSSQI